MPPNNFLVPTSTAKTDGGESSNDEQMQEVNSRLLNRKSKNVLNTSEKIKRLETIEKIEPIIVEDKKEEKVEEQKEFVAEWVWPNIIAFIILHICFFKGALMLRPNALSLYYYLVAIIGGFGITAGAHRLWAHGSYKAKLPLRIILAFFQTMAFQNSIYEWSRDHRSHHKFTDTNADPHSASRGIFFAHMGWLMCKKHPDVKKYGEKIDMSDLERDPVVVFQRKYYLILMPICQVIPMLISMYYFNASFTTSFYLNAWRYCFSLHSTWLVNSYAHFYGTKPFDKNIKPTDSYLVSFFAFGEGWHNYHHVFPYDYKTSDHHRYWCNLTTAFLDFMAKIGWATDLKMIDSKLVSKRALRTGDGSHISSRIFLNNNYDDSRTFETTEHIWGWQDVLVNEEEKSVVKIIKKTESIL